MKYLSVLAASAIAATGWAGVSVAQSSSQAVPAEFPPASYTGRQYVDSAGCVFIRAGIDNNVTWVPRLTRGRQQVCGFQPSLSASTLASVNAARTPAPVEATTPSAATTSAPATTPQPAPAPSPAPAPRKVAAPAPTPAQAPTIAAAPPKPEPKVVASTRVVAKSKCTNRSAFSQRYMHSERADVRCGPQTQPHVTYKDGPPSPNATYYTHASAGVTNSHVRVAPKHVYENQIISTEGVFVPEGYTVVWEDDRLNTHRAHQTFAGKAQMEQIWTNTLPRQIKPGTIAGSHVSYAAGGVPDDAAAPEVTRTATLDSAPALVTKDKPASHRYVQIGAFSDATQAKQAAQRLANSGLPTKMGDRTRGGKTYTLVVVGPYQTQSALDGGLARVRGMGYSQASLKR